VSQPPMSDLHGENRRLWNEWSDDFQAIWNADTADGDLHETLFRVPQSVRFWAVAA